MKHVLLPRLGSVLILGGLFLLVSLIRTEFSFAVVIGSSMEPTLHQGELLILRRGAYREDAPQRGDLVVARHADDVIVKRVVGLPGESIEVIRGELYINDVRLDEDHEVLPGWLDLGRGRLRQGRYALLGDNRSMAPGETVHAIVSLSNLLGKVVLTVRLLPTPSRPATDANLHADLHES